jgi:hypothetical protein
MNATTHFLGNDSPVIASVARCRVAIAPRNDEFVSGALSWIAALRSQ